MAKTKEEEEKESNNKYKNNNLYFLFSKILSQMKAFVETVILDWRD